MLKKLIMGGTTLMLIAILSVPAFAATNSGCTPCGTSACAANGQKCITVYCPSTCSNNAALCKLLNQAMKQCKAKGINASKCRVIKLSNSKCSSPKSCVYYLNTCNAR